MQGSLDLHRGTLFVGDQEKTARVQLFDLEGRRLGGGFQFRDATVGRSAAAGIAVDDDRRIFVADTPASRVRVFSVFGRESPGFASSAALVAPQRADLAGILHVPVDVAVQGNADDGVLVIACAGERRHAVQVFDPGLTWRRSLASTGDPGRMFSGVRRVECHGRLILVAEAGSGRVQVFRDGDFLYLFSLSSRGNGRLTPSAIAAVGASAEDGRMVVSCSGPASGVVLVDSAGRWIRTLAGPGEQEGSVHDPSDVVVHPGEDDRSTRIAVIDRDGLRIQVFDLEGGLQASFPVTVSAGEDDASARGESGERTGG